MDWRGPRVTGLVDRTIDRAMWQAGGELRRQSNHIVPHDTGALMRSCSLDYDPDTKTVVLSYGNTDVPYAITVHEHPEWNFRQGREGKWLENTWKRHGPRAARWVAEQVKRVLR